MPAYSYLRFSTPGQADGDSIRRQTKLTADWCRRNGIDLDTSISLRDEGVSAFKGKHRDNPDTHALASFLNAVKMGRVQAGSYLIVESLDRLSREKITPALTLLLNLIGSGIRVVQLIPHEMVYDEDVKPEMLMMAIMELSRGHSESKVKSERVGGAWGEKRKTRRNGEPQPARKENRVNGMMILTRKLPGWIKESDGKLRVQPEHAATIKRIFRLARSGHGVHAIARDLNKREVPTMGRKVFEGRPVVWNETVVYHLLKSRAVIGEYQPCRVSGGKRQPDGDPILDYFPAVIDQDTFYAVQTALKSRCNHGAGRRGRHVNLLAGLLVDARDGGSLTYKHIKARSASIVPVGAKHGKGTAWTSFPAEPLEEAIRSKLIEIKASDIAGDSEPAHKVEALSGRLAELDGLIKSWQAKMDDPNLVDVVGAKLSELGGKRKALAGELQDAQRDAANPVAEAWGEFRTLAGLNPDKDTPDLRLRIKAALRRCVESIHCIFAGCGRYRLAEVQVTFKGGHHRYYLIAYRPGYSNHRIKRDGAWAVRSMKFPENAVHEDSPARWSGQDDLRTADPAVIAMQAECLADYGTENIERLLFSMPDNFDDPARRS